MALKEAIEQYKDLFLSEAKQQIESMNSFLVKFEKNPHKLELITNIFRGAHTLKSMAVTMEYHNISNLCHALEDILDLTRKKKLDSRIAIDLLFNSLDILDSAIKQVSKNKEEPKLDEVIQRLKEIASQKHKTEFKEQNLEFTNLYSQFIEKISTIDVRVERLDVLVNLIEELLIYKMRLDRIKETLTNPELTASVDTLGRIISDLQYNIMQARMVPVSFIFNRFPRMVRDLAKKENKEVNFTCEGGDLKLDRAVIDELGEPLVHLLRNAIAHGIETKEERRRKKKKEEGVLKLTAKSEKGSAIITIEDDGAGLNFEALKSQTIKSGVLSSNATYDDVKNIIFSGISTSKKITKESGRGIGLNIVKNKIDSLGGNIKVETKERGGTKFNIELPLTLAIIKTLFVGVGGKTYAIPLVNIERLINVPKSEIKGMAGYEAIIYDEEDIPLIRLNELFNIASLQKKKEAIAIVRKGKEKIGLIVDSLMTTHEIVLKPLTKAIKENKYFAGSSIIGSGEVILVLDIGNLALQKKIRGMSNDK